MMSDEKGQERRGFLRKASVAAMAGGMVAGYGAFGTVAGRFLYPAGSTPKEWRYVARVADIAPGASLNFRTPTGARVAIARRGAGTDVGAFAALSRVCPHLGCQVHWESDKERFFCPCHNGAFDADGIATEGPPKEAAQTLAKYPLKIVDGLLYIETEVPAGGDERADAGDEIDEAPPGPGHDPCLFERPGEGRA